MARRTARHGTRTQEGQPGWLLTYSDLMTLLLAFFVLLVSMSTIDERRRRMVIESVFGGIGLMQTGSGEASGDRLVPLTAPDAQHDARRDLGPLKATLDGAQGKGVDFFDNGSVQILSIDADVLFGPGETRLSKEGERLLATFAPTLRTIEHPLLVAGHASPPRDEQGAGFRLRAEGTLSPSWMLSLRRATSVYRALRDLGVPSSRLILEGFGDGHPRHDAFTATGRRANRRVDLVLDKRNLAWLQQRQGTARETQYDYKGFRFGLESPAPAGSPPAPPGAPGTTPDVIPGTPDAATPSSSTATPQLPRAFDGVDGNGEVRAPALGPTLVPVRPGTTAAPAGVNRFATPPEVTIPAPSPASEAVP